MGWEARTPLGVGGVKSGINVLPNPVGIASASFRMTAIGQVTYPLLSLDTS